MRPPRLAPLARAAALLLLRLQLLLLLLRSLVLVPYPTGAQAARPPATVSVGFLRS